MGAAETKNEKNQTAVDETNGLSVEEKNLIRSSWEQIMKNKRKVGVDVFVRLFTNYPKSKELFEQLRDIPTEDLRNHKKMKAHALRVMASLNSVVESLDDLEILGEMLQNVGRTHVLHHVEKHYYDSLAVVLLEAFEDELKDKFNQKTRNAWTKAYGAMEKVIVEAYGDA
ncbi:Globin C, coelomic [Holothuria leucospilota]|uniref:Globin C, coelomic n=1 Tax=Holothuria leucospilota TaxID=206669 RepID=A0A9Q1H8V3_HOLLE|nr:Globin C, coelomic [Holothuria leucospilota]